VEFKKKKHENHGWRGLALKSYERMMGASS
jgi:hypothetical protein